MSFPASATFASLAIDLRWGVSEEDALDQQMLTSCGSEPLDGDCGSVVYGVR